MRLPWLSIALLAGLVPSSAGARCAPYDAHLFKGHLVSCRAMAAGDIPEGDPGVDASAARGDLARRPASLALVRVESRRRAARCDWEGGCEPASGEWEPVRDGEHLFQLDGSCEASIFEPGAEVTFFAARPCCDTLPSRGARCATGHPVVQPDPGPPPGENPTTGAR